MSSEPLKILYRNRRGEVAVRTITPEKPWYGESDWHDGKQWFLEAFCHDKRDWRDFAVCGILATGEAAIAAYLEMQEKAAALEAARKKVEEARAKPLCPRCHGSGEVSDDIGFFECPHCNGEGVRDA